MQADFAIITIREDEYKALASRFNPTPQRGASGRNYAISQIQTKDGKKRTVAINRCEEQGPQPAQQLANDMIKDLSPSLLLVVGIAGGVPDTDFTLGDVVISSRIHDFGVNALKPGKIDWDARGGIHPYVSDIISSLPMYETDLEGWNAADSLRAPRPALDITKFKAFDLTSMTPRDKQSIFDGNPPESWQQKILDMLKWHFDDPPQRPPEPLYKSGSIGSSGSLVRDTAILIQWLQDARSIRAIEMEAGGVFQAAQQLHRQYPVMAIRGISDIVGLKRDYRWTPYACHSAATFAYALLTSNSTIFDNLQRPNPVVSAYPPSPRNSGTTTQVGTPLLGAQENPRDALIQIYISYAEKDEELKVMDPTVFIEDEETIPLVRIFQRFAMKMPRNSNRRAVLKNAGIDENFIALCDLDAVPSIFAQELVEAFRDFSVSDNKPDYHPLLQVIRYLTAPGQFYQLQDQERNLLQTLAKRGQNNCKILSVRKSLGRLESPEGHAIGTGTLISENILLTCAHVFDETENQPLWVRLGYTGENGQGTPYQLSEEFVYCQHRPDHALVKIQGSPSVKPLLPRKKALDRGQYITLVHHPSGRSQEVSDTIQIAEVGVDYIVYSLPTERGSSGAPIFDRDWHLVAMHRGETALEHSNAGTAEGIPLSAFWSTLARFVPRVKG